MTNKIFQIISVLSVVIVAFGCAKKEEKKNSSASSTANYQSVDMNGQKVLLKYQFKKGEKLRYKLTTITNSLETIQTDSLMKTSADQTLNYFFDMEVLDVDKDNVAELGVNISAVTFNANINGQKFNYDSKASTSKEEKLKFLEYETIVNTPFRARISPKGEVLEVSRIDKMVEKMNSLQPQKQDLPVEQKAALTKNLGEQAIRPITQLLFREMTTGAVGKDSSWIKSYPGTLGVFTMENIAKFKVEDFVKVGDDKAAKLSADLSIKWSGDKKGNQNGINYNFAEPKVSGGGTILFNIDKGKLIKGETATNVEMSVQLETKNSLQKSMKTTRKNITTNKNIVELL